jgi:hypothetical protein
MSEIKRSGKKICDEIRETDFDLDLSGTPREPEYYVRNRNLSKKDFETALDVYVNNQDYFLEKKDYESLRGLEHWFIHVIEPIPRDLFLLDEWIERELAKREGYSYNCPEVAKKKFSLKVSDITFCIKDLETTVLIYEEKKKQNSLKKK